MQEQQFDRFSDDFDVKETQPVDGLPVNFKVGDSGRVFGQKLTQHLEQSSYTADDHAQARSIAHQTLTQAHTPKPATIEQVEQAWDRAAKILRRQTINSITTRYPESAYIAAQRRADADVAWIEGRISRLLPEVQKSLLTRFLTEMRDATDNPGPVATTVTGLANQIHQVLSRPQSYEARSVLLNGFDQIEAPPLDQRGYVLHQHASANGVRVALDKPFDTAKTAEAWVAHRDKSPHEVADRDAEGKSLLASKPQLATIDIKPKQIFDPYGVVPGSDREMSQLAAQEMRARGGLDQRERTIFLQRRGFAAECLTHNGANYGVSNVVREMRVFNPERVRLSTTEMSKDNRVFGSDDKHTASRPGQKLH